MSKRIAALAVALVFSASGWAMAVDAYNIGILQEPKTDNIIAAFGPDNTTYTYAVLMPMHSALYGLIAPTWDFIPYLAAGEPGPIVSESVEGRRYYTSVVPLRRDLRWSDGKFLTADDVAFSYNAILALDPVKLGGHWANRVNPDLLDRVEILDEHTVKFWLKRRPGLAEWQYGLLQSVILSSAHWGPVVEEALASDDPVKAVMAFRDVNPVTITGWTAGRVEPGAFWENRKAPHSVAPFEKSIFYENGGVAVYNSLTSYSFATGDTSGQVTLTIDGGPHVDRALYRVYLSQSAAMQALMADEIDYLYNPDGFQKGFQQQLAAKDNLRTIENPANGFRFLAFNMRRPPMDNAAFRQAVATIINKEFVAENVLQGVAQPLHSFVPPANAYWHNPHVRVWGEGMDNGERAVEAIRMLKEAGFTWEKEPVVDAAVGVVHPGTGLIQPDGVPVPPLEILGPSPGQDPLRSTFALWIERWLNDLGIPARARLTDFNLIVDRVNARDFDMFILGWGLTIYPDYLHHLFHSSQAEAGYNDPGYSNPEFDAVIEAFAAATTLEEARPLAFRAQAILAEDVPYVVLYNTQIVEAFHRRLEFPFTEVLDGIQRLYGMPSHVKIRE